MMVLSSIVSIQKSITKITLRLSLYTRTNIVASLKETTTDNWYLFLYWLSTLQFGDQTGSTPAGGKKRRAKKEAADKDSGKKDKESTSNKKREKDKKSSAKKDKDKKKSSVKKDKDKKKSKLSSGTKTSSVPEEEHDTIELWANFDSIDSVCNFMPHQNKVHCPTWFCNAPLSLSVLSINLSDLRNVGSI